jgi:hypothetical protein
MTARYFGVNSLAGGFRNSTAIVEDTTAGRFNSTYVSNCINLSNSSVNFFQITKPFLDGSTSLSSTFYLRFDYGISTNYNGTGPILLILSGATNAYRIIGTGSTTAQVQYWNTGTSAWVNWGAGLTLSSTGGGRATYMLKLTPGTSYTLYQAGTSIGSDGGTVPTNPVSSVDTFQWSTVNGTAYVSEIMCADYDIRDAHLMTAALNGNSATNTGGTGAYTDINETVLDESTAEIVTTVGNKMGQTHASITVPSGLGIGAVIINARGRVSGGTVTDGKLGVRSGSTNSSSTGRSYNGGYEPRGAIWSADPATSGAWTQTSFNAAETYLEAA